MRRLSRWGILTILLIFAGVWWGRAEWVCSRSPARLGLSSTLVIDLRDEFADGHIPGAVSIAPEALGAFLADELHVGGFLSGLYAMRVLGLAKGGVGVVSGVASGLLLADAPRPM